MEDNAAETIFLPSRIRAMQAFRARVLLVMCVFPVASALAFTVVALSIPLYGMLRHKDQLLEAEVRGVQILPSLEVKIAEIESRQKQLSTGSMDGRLKNIEDAIRAGTVRPEQLTTLDDIRQDLELLKSYMLRDPKELVALKQLQSDYRGLRDSQKDMPTRTDTGRDISGIKDLLYLTWGVIGLLATIFVGIIYGVPWKRPVAVSTQPVGNPPGLPTSESSGVSSQQQEEAK